MKETEVEIEERIEETEVERVYCDGCGTECTDDYGVEPRHVCRDCGGRRLRQGLPEGEPSFDVDRGFWFMTIVLWPVFAPAAFFDGLDDREDGVAWAFVTGAIGALIWGGFALLMLLLL